MAEIDGALAEEGVLKEAAAFEGWIEVNTTDRDGMLVVFRLSTAQPLTVSLPHRRQILLHGSVDGSSSAAQRSISTLAILMATRAAEQSEWILRS